MPLTSLQGLPIFPLPRVVLMPGELLPLHVFEPRYRALVRTCLEVDRMIGMATLMPGYELDYEGAPAVFPEIGVGRIVRHQALADGRSNILVAWVAAGALCTEIETAEPFRRMEVAVLPDVEAGTYTGVGSLRHLALQVAATTPELRGPVFELEGPPFVDGLARIVLVDSDERRAYLRSRRGDERVDLVRAGLIGLMADASPADEA